MINPFTKNDYVERGISRLHHDFSDKEKSPKLHNFLALFLEQIQEIEYIVWGFFSSMDLETSGGRWLDFHGKRLVEPRDGLSDNSYRRFLIAKQKINSIHRSSNFTRDSLLSVLEEITNGTEINVVKKEAGLRIQYQVDKSNSVSEQQKIKKFVELMSGHTNKFWITERVAGDFGFTETPQHQPFNLGNFSKSL